MRASERNEGINQTNRKGKGVPSLGWKGTEGTDGPGAQQQYCMHEKNDATGRTTRRKGTETETVRRQRLFTVLAGRQRGRPNASRAAGSCRLLFRRDGAGAFPCSRCLHATLTHKRCKQPHSRVAIPLPHPHSRRVVAPVHLHQHQSASRRRRRRVCVSVCACKKVIQHASCSITGADGDEAECHQPFFVVVSPVRSLLRLALAFARSRSPSFLIFPLSIIRTWLFPSSVHNTLSFHCSGRPLSCILPLVVIVSSNNQIRGRPSR